MGKATIEQYDSLAAKAAAFAVVAHEGQKRKGTGYPYVVHPIGVAHILRELYKDEELEAAGYLHDVLEDTDTKPTVLADKFGHRVLYLVESVTRKPGWDLADFVGVPDVLRLKAADTIDNVTDTIRGLEKGHNVWGRFSKGQDKIVQWRGTADLVMEWMWDEPIAGRLTSLVSYAGALQRKAARDG